MTSQEPLTPKQPSTFQDRRLWLVAAVLLSAIGLGVRFVLADLNQRQAAEEEAAQPLPEQVKVAALGRVEPVGGVVNIATSQEGIVSELLVDVGNFVVQGQILAYLDLYEVRQAERNFAESQLIEAQEKLTAQLNLGEARVREADTRIAQIDLPQEESMRSKAAEIRDLEAQLALAKIDLRRFQSLASEGAIARQELDRQIATVQQLDERVAAAEAQLAQLGSARSADLDNASAQVNAAEANLQVSQAEAGVRSAERNLALAEAKLAQTILRAPTNGQVIEVFVEAGESTNSSSQGILSLGNTEQMQVVAEVYETDVGLVEVGQPATIRSRNGAFDEILTGTVEEIALQIFKNDVLDDDPAANADARVVEVDIAIDQADVIDSLTNLQVDVVIEVKESSPQALEEDS